MKAGNHIKLIMDGQRNLTRNHIQNVAKVCGLKKRQAEFFLNLTELNHCKDPRSQEVYWQRLQKLTPKKEINILDQVQTKVLSKWYALPLLEMLNLKGFKYDPKMIARRFGGDLSAKEVQEAFGLLDEAGLIEFNNGQPKIKHGSNFIGGDIPSQLIKLFHSKIIQQSVNPLFETDVALREYSAATVSIRPQDIARFKKKIQEFQEEIVMECDQIENPDELYQINIQFFPLLK